MARIADDGKALMLHGAQEPWNPRTDNGHAFQLSMIARIMVRQIGPYIIRGWENTASSQI